MKFYLFCFIILAATIIADEPCACEKEQFHISDMCTKCRGSGEFTQNEDVYLCGSCFGTGCVVKHCGCIISTYIPGNMSLFQATEAVNRILPYLKKYNNTAHYKYQMFREKGLKSAALGIMLLKDYAELTLPTVVKTVKKMTEAVKKDGHYGVDPYLEMIIIKIFLAAKKASVSHLIKMIDDEDCRTFAIGILSDLDTDISEAVPHIMRYKNDKRGDVQEAFSYFVKKRKDKKQ
ncbi:hypothetical protein [Candidatus Uabimicrobium sp. HlEnr_7]|uniref:hypothetical protein n=1 Tax=Candidatus Uabimicrobium helgolandensis TaxID=3095367 RepID=UPI0035588BB7